MTDNEIGYEGIDEADLIHGLYHGTRPLGLGFLHNTPGLTVDDVRRDLDECAKDEKVLYFDYYRGRPLKCSLDTERKVLRGVRLYDRDAGHGACAAVLASLRRTS